MCGDGLLAHHQQLLYLLVQLLMEYVLLDVMEMMERWLVMSWLYLVLERDMAIIIGYL